MIRVGGKGKRASSALKRPRSGRVLAPPSKAAEPDSPDLLMKAVQRVEVARQAVVGIVPAQHAGSSQRCCSAIGACMRPPASCRSTLQLARQPLALRLALHHEPPVPGPPAVVGEAEKGERLAAAARRAARRCAAPASRPNSIRRVLSSWSVRPNFASRSLRADQHLAVHPPRSGSPSRSRRRSAR